MILYGLKTCDACRKALKALAAEGRAVTLRDVRADGVARSDLDAWVAALGPAALVNRRSATWRGLDQATRDRALSPTGAAQVLADWPTLMKRPVIVADGAITAGWPPQTPPTPL